MIAVFFFHLNLLVKHIFFFIFTLLQMKRFYCGTQLGAEVLSFWVTMKCVVDSGIHFPWFCLWTSVWGYREGRVGRRWWVNKRQKRGRTAKEACDWGLGEQSWSTRQAASLMSLDNWSSSCDPRGDEPTSAAGGGGVCQVPGCVSSERQAVFSGILLETNTGNEPPTQGLYAGKRRNPRGFTLCERWWLLSESRSQRWGWDSLSQTPGQSEWFTWLTISSLRAAILSVAHRIQPLHEWQIKGTHQFLHGILA